MRQDCGSAISPAVAQQLTRISASSGLAASAASPELGMGAEASESTTAGIRRLGTIRKLPAETEI